MALIYECDKIFRKVVQQGRWRCPWGPPGKVTGIVFYAVAVAKLLEHFNVQVGALFKPLGLNKAVFSLKVEKAFIKFMLYLYYGLFKGPFICDIVT